MIKLGKLTDYAIVVMGQLSGEALSAHAVSTRTGVPEPTVAKVLKQLSHAKLVESTRGAGGGYRLAKPANQTTIAEVITAMDGPIAIVSCVDDSGEVCKSQGLCPSKGKWNRVNQAIRNALESVMISDMSAPRNFIKVEKHVRHE